MIDTRRSTTPGIWEPTPTKSLSERLRELARWLEYEGYETNAKMVREAAEALDAKDALLAEVVEALEILVAGILDYEKVNNLAPSPGKQDCWQSVTHARAVLAKIKGHAMTSTQSLSERLRYVSEKRCCTICDAKKVCHVCGEQTLLACADCQINFAATVYVCKKSECRDEHERKCYGAKP